MLKTKLFPFQQEAYEKLIKLRVGALYLEMGLGKTRTALELVQTRLEKNKIEKVLWLCPCSTKKNLEQQIKEHSDLIHKIEIFGIESISMSDNIYIQVYDIVSQYNCMLIVDESNLVKNHKAIRSKRIMELSSYCKYKLILNGTPVTRNEADLFSQWYILDWRILGYRSYFSFSANHLTWDEEHKKITNVFNKNYLTNRIAPYTYQARKKDVLHLPEKNYEKVFYSMTDTQRKHYNFIKEIFLEEIEKSTAFSTTYIIYKMLTALQHIVSGRDIVSTDVISTKNHFKNIEDNPRIQSLLNTISQISTDEKIIIWCKYTKEIEEVNSILKKEFGENSTTLFYGEISQKKRNEEIEKFKTSARFLIGNKNSGGYGLNLQFASYMIFYSNDFDWGTRSQAEDRIHRIGQNYNTTYIDLIAYGSIDERIIDNLVRKENLVSSLKRLLEMKKDKKILGEWIDGDDEKVEINRKNLKKYTDKSVLEAAQERISYIFDEFENICLSFSGGKDSGVCLNLMIDEARKRGRKFGVLHIDVEAEYQMTSDFIKRIIENNRDVIIPYWVCLPMESPNSLSYLEPTWVWWDKEKELIWVREMPKMDYIINENNNPIDFYTPKMPFEEFIKHFGTWYGKGEKTAIIVGIRTQESLNRFRAICNNKYNYKDKKYSTNLEGKVYNFYPIYDWDVEDIWIYNGKFEKDYNKLYDLFYKAGVPISKMRVDEPFGNEAKAGLSLFKVIEPQTWAKVVNRVSGANFGNIYHNTKIMKANYTLPKNHTWKSFTKFLLSTLPEETANNYKIKFIKFIKYWHKIGCGVPEDMLELLENKYSDYIENTNSLSNRGSKNKTVVRFRKILDEAPEVGMAKQLLTWKRMAMCIIKNDYLCKGLCFGTTKDLTLRQQEIIKKYKEL